MKGEPEKGWMVLESDEDGVNLVLTFSKVRLLHILHRPNVYAA